MGVGRLSVWLLNAATTPSTTQTSATVCSTKCQALLCALSVTPIRGALYASTASPIRTGNASVRRSGCQLKSCRGKVGPELSFRGLQAQLICRAGSRQACAEMSSPAERTCEVSLPPWPSARGVNRKPPKKPSSQVAMTASTATCAEGPRQ